MSAADPRLCPLTPAAATLALADPAAFAATVGLSLAADWPAPGLDRVFAGLVERFGDATLGTWVFWIVVHDAIVGEIGARSPPVHGVVEVGYRVAPSARGRGVATRALALFVEHAHAHGAERVRAEVLLENVASRRVLEKAGFVRAAAGDTVQTRCWETEARRCPATPAPGGANGPG